MAQVFLGTTSHEHVIIDVRSRIGESDDRLDATISLRAGSFAACFDAMLVTVDFPRFREQLETLYQELTGTAIFDTMENQLALDCTGNGHGGITISGVARDRVVDGNILRFRFNTDQTFVPQIIAEIREIESQFPSLDKYNV